MKTIQVVLTSGLVGLVSAVAQAQAPSTAVSAPSGAAGGPKVQFATNTFDFGKVMAGEVVRHDFVFTNLGASVLEIKEVRPGCGCTTAGTWDKLVEPGKTGKIPLQFNSAGFGGPIAKSATITCNDPAQSNVVLQIKGTVWKPVDISPSMAVFNLPSEGQTNETKVIRIVNNQETPMALSDLQCTNRAFRAELKTIKEGKEFEVHVSTVTPIESGSVNAPITLKSTATNMPTIRVTAYAVVQQAVVVSPAQITLPAGPLKNPESRPILIRNNSSQTMTVSDVAINVPGAEVTLKESQPGKVFGLMVSFPAGFQVQTGQRVEVTAKSNHPKYAQIRVPVMQSQVVARPALAPAAPVPATTVLATNRPATAAPVPQARIVPQQPAKPPGVER